MDLLKGAGQSLPNHVVIFSPAVRSGPHGHLRSWLRRHLDRSVGGGGPHVDIWSQELLQGEYPHTVDLLYIIIVAFLGNISLGQFSINVCLLCSHSCIYVLCL